MGRYYFYCGGSEVLSDGRHGRVFATLHDARQQGIRALLDLAKDLPTDDGIQNMTMDVRDKDRHSVARLRLQFAPAPPDES